MAVSGPLASGENALLVDLKGRRYLIRLQNGGQFHYHQGFVSHDEMIGKEEGFRLQSSGGGSLLVLRPRLADFVLKMPRGATVVYPKDMGPIAVYADLGPGMTVLEAGTGSGALTLALLRFVGPSGRVVSVERRDDHAGHARKIIERWMGEVPANLDLRIGDVEEVIAEIAPERIVLDLPEPWHSVKVAAEHQPGGESCAPISRPSPRFKLSPMPCETAAPTRRSRSSKPSLGRGPWRAVRFDPTTGWSATPVSW